MAISSAWTCQMQRTCTPFAMWCDSDACLPAHARSVSDGIITNPTHQGTMLEHLFV